MAFSMIAADPMVISCQANAAITAGDLVKTVSSTDVVTSAGVSSYKTSDILVESADASGDGNKVIGVAGADASASGDTIPVRTRGLFIFRAVEAITAGNLVQASVETSGTDAQEVAVWDEDATGVVDEVIGRAITGTSAANKYLIVLLRP